MPTIGCLTHGKTRVPHKKQHILAILHLGDQFCIQGDFGVLRGTQYDVLS